MKKIVPISICVIGLILWLNHANGQAIGAPQWHWEYAQFDEIQALNQFQFNACGKILRGDSLVALSTVITGQKPALGPGQTDLTFLDIMNAAGLQRWEIVSERETQTGRSILFKRVVQ